MHKITGVTVSVLDEQGNPINVAVDGYLGRLDGKRVVLQAVIDDPNRRTYAFLRDCKYKIAKKRAIDFDGGWKHRLIVSIQQNDKGVHYTLHPANNLRLAEFSMDNDFYNTGAVTLWSIAVISQKGEFFLTIQRGNESRCHKDGGGNITYPDFEEEWPELNEYLLGLLPYSVNPVAHVNDYTIDEEIPVTGMADDEGIVQWYDEAQGVGSIATNKGDAKVHWSQIERRPRRAFLAPEERVRFSGLRKPKNTHVGRETTFGIEAVGVTVVAHEETLTHV
jgi:cold shock CspA family protein